MNTKLIAHNVHSEKIFVLSLNANLTHLHQKVRSGVIKEIEPIFSHSYSARKVDDDLFIKKLKNCSKILVKILFFV